MTDRQVFRRGDALLHVVDTGTGLPLVFQHGLGGDRFQVEENVPAPPGWRRITVECRGQGESLAGIADAPSITLFADDILAVCDELRLERFVVGGISMGAAIALRLAVTHPDRVRGLILARPAWTFDPAPANMQPFVTLADLLRSDDRETGRARFAESPTGQMLADTAPDNFASLLGFFARPDLAGTAQLLDAIARSGPDVSRSAVKALDVPTLVIGHEIDHIHPLAMAVTLAETIPGAQLVEITPKATDKPRHVAEFRQAITQFLASLDNQGQTDGGEH